jgi:flagellar basal body rod protein FlgG
LSDRMQRRGLRLPAITGPMSVTSIAASGMLAAERRLEIAARNVANATTGLPADAPDKVVAAFKSLRADQVETPGGGTAVNAVLTDSEVDLTQQAVELTIARYTFAANANVMRAAAKMQKSVLDISA